MGGEGEQEVSELQVLIAVVGGGLFANIVLQAMFSAWRDNRLERIAEALERIANLR
jgi:hypothetical protein